MSYSKNALGYSEETEPTPHITTMYSRVSPKIFLVILWRQHILLTLLLGTAELF